MLFHFCPTPHSNFIPRSESVESPILSLLTIHGSSGPECVKMKAAPAALQTCAGGQMTCMIIF